MACDAKTGSSPVRTAASRRLARFVRNEAGATAILFGLTLVPIIGFAGAAVDYANAYRIRSELQNALDAAALAAARAMDASDNESVAQQTGDKVLQSNLGAGFPAGVSATFTITDDIVTATAGLPVSTYLLGVIGIDTIDVGTTSVVNIAGGTYEVALVLDNSGSMAGTKINDLKEAAGNLVDVLFANQSTSDHVKIGLVPFAATVNVGPQHATAPWMDQTGQSSIHKEHFDTNVTRWDRFNALNNVSWGGCVEVRPSPHDVQDTPPTGGDSLFVPLFAPDEPDTSGTYKNSYIDDDDGSCPASMSGGSNAERQSRSCKYDGENADTGLAFGTRRGPNHLCDSQPLQALTDSSTQISAAIEAMEAYGGTNIHEALMWGWRLLSPGEPFTQGAADDQENNTKIVILMSDGQNWHGSLGTHNESWYSAYGYHAQNRLNAPDGSTETLRATMNARTAQACENAKGAGVVIYALALEISDETTEDMLRNCASGSAKFFTLENSDALDDVFQAIAEEISKLRIAS